MTITASEFGLNPDKYLALAENEDIYISNNGKVSVKLVSTKQDKAEAMQSLFGCISADITLEAAKEERLRRKNLD